MQYLRIILSLFVVFYYLAAPSSATAQGDSVITIAADSWCPINCARPESRLGVGIDLAKAVFEPLGFKIEYKIMPWSEALDKVRAGEIDAVIGASRYDDAKLIFPRYHIYDISDDFYVLKGNSWRFQGVHTLKGRKLGIIEDYGYGPAISEYIRNNKTKPELIQQATGDKALLDNIRKLQNREIDVIVETRPVMEYTISKIQPGGRRLDDKIEWAGSSPQAPVFLAFSPSLAQSKTMAAQFDAGIKRLESEGKLEGFYRAYGLSLTER